jgi:polar amino acid transport system permease protein
MMGIARTIVAETYAPYEIFISLAIIYMIFTFFIQKGFGYFENFMSRHIKK